MAAAPLDHSPGLDETGADMAYGQSGPVWFLLANFTGGTTTRTGVVPTGTMLFLTLMAFETSSREGYGETEAELLAAAAGIIDMVTDMACEVDGVPVQGLDLYRFHSPELFSLTVPEDNVFDLWGVETPAGTYYPSAADGYYLMLAPLSAGQHTPTTIGRPADHQGGTSSLPAIRDATTWIAGPTAMMTPRPRQRPSRWRRRRASRATARGITQARPGGRASAPRPAAPGPTGRIVSVPACPGPCVSPARTTRVRPGNPQHRRCVLKGGHAVTLS